MPMLNPDPPPRRLVRPLPSKRITSPFNAPTRDYTQNLLLAMGVEAFVSEGMAHTRTIPFLTALVRSADPNLPSSAPSPALLARACGRFLRENPDPVEPRLPDEPARANLRLVQELLGLDEAEARVTGLIATVAEDSAFKRFLSTAGDYGSAQTHALVAAAVNLPVAEVRRAMALGGKLVSSGIVSVTRGSCSLDDRFTLKRGLADLLAAPGLTRAELVHQLLPEAKPSDLTMDDFVHLQGEAATTKALLAQALRGRERGVNVLFVGETGTGKSALAALIARELGVRLHTAGTADDDGDAAKPSERLSSILLGQRLFAGGGCLLVFDELEDVLAAAQRAPSDDASGRNGPISKLWFNLLLEDNPVPTIWISNSVDGVDPAFLRRFAYVIRFDTAGPRQRTRALQRHLRPEEASPDEVAHLARRYHASPAQLATAARTARLVSPTGTATAESLDRVLAPMERLLHPGRPATRHFDPRAFRLDGVRADTDLSAVADQLALWKPSERPGVSLCLYGPPGTGKTEFAVFLAHQCGRPLVSRRGSDLLSMWVGGTERAIAEAFREAESEGALLLLDEVDSFLRDRQTARSGWEVSQVNELLQQLESFRGLVVCTTNLLRELDPAALRRFVFKVEFAYAGPRQCAVLFDALLAHFLPEPLGAEALAVVHRELARMSTLTPGDFAAVARRFRALGGAHGFDRLLAALAGEVKIKPGVRAAAGFA